MSRVPARRVSRRRDSALLVAPTARDARRCDDDGRLVRRELDRVPNVRNHEGPRVLIADGASGAPLGLCGVDEWFADDSVQIGYFFAAEARGKGSATRAVRLLTKWLLDLGAASVFATTNPLNAVSIAVLRRAGFAPRTRRRELGMHEGVPDDVALYAHSADAGPPPA
jgi:RimJ/RimL family protein N-acetyltransferase